MRKLTKRQYTRLVSACSLMALSLVALSGCALPRSSGVSPLAAQAASSRPYNVVLIVADDLGYGDLSVYGGPVKTPNIDALAADGARFTRAYASAYQCSPSRAGFLTGRYQERFGHESNFTGPGDEPGGPGLLAGLAAFEAGTIGPTGLGLPRNVPMVQERLRKAGIRTAAIGKWHLGFDTGMRPLDRGFDEFYGFLAGSSPYALASTPDIEAVGRLAKPGKAAGEEDDEGLGSPLPDKRLLYYTLRDGDTPVVHQDAYMTDMLTERAVDFISRQSNDQPFFLYLAHLAPHQPLTATKKWYDRLSDIPDRKRRIYYAMILALDDSVGQVRAALRAKGLEDNTLIIFTSDNGCPRPGVFCSNGVLREGKQTLFEGGIRIPLIAALPGHIPAGRVDETPANLLDLTPTILDYMGQSAVKGLDGHDLRARMEPPPSGEAPYRAGPFFWRHQIHRAIVDQNWKLIIYQASDGRPAYFLYDLQTDPGEHVNLASQQPQRVETMKRRLFDWDGTLASPRWVPSKTKTRTFDGVTVELY